MTAMGWMLCLIQPFRSALPIRPAPTRSVSGSLCLRLARTLEHCGGDRLFRGFSAPQHELKRRVIMLAGFHGEIEQGFALRRACPSIRENHSVPENERALVGEQIEMPDPKLRVDMHQERSHLGAPRALHPHLERGGEVQRLQVLAPGEAEVM